MTCNTCGMFGYDVDDGMKALSIAETFASSLHLISACNIAATYTRPFVKFYIKKGGGFFGLVELVLQCVLILTLVLLGIIGFLLYAVAWRKKNITICYMWVILGPLNLLMVMVLGTIHVITEYESYTVPLSSNKTFNASTYADAVVPICKMRVPIPSLLYLLYVPYSALVQIGFIRWAKKQGIAVEYSVSEIKSEVKHGVLHDHKHHEHKKSIDHRHDGSSDDEAGEV